MNVKHNINYYKKSDTMKLVGIALALVGFAMLFFGFGWISYILATIGLPTGVVLFFVGSAARSSEADIDECIKRGSEGMEVALEDDRHYAKRIIKHQPPITLEGYEYDDDLMFKKAKNGSVRSSRYTKAIVYILSDRLYVSEGSIYLTEDRVDKRILELGYEDISKVEIHREEKSVSFNKKSFAVKVCRFEVYVKDSVEWSVPMNDDVGIEKTIEKLNLMIEEFKKAREENS